MRKYEIENYKSGKNYLMVPATDIETSEDQYENIRKICNEPPILNLFRGLNEYPIEKSKSFIEWACDGWNSDSYYVFLIVDKSTNLVVAAIDIKSRDLDGEIGYWCSQSHNGLISNAVKALISFAREKGYRSLYAKPINYRSESVLIRNLFTLKNGDVEKTFEKILNP